MPESQQITAQTVYDEIRGLLEASVVGSRIPPERELAERFGTTRTTVRNALDRCEREGRITRHQGAGTFVTRPHAKPRIAHQLVITSFSEEMRMLGMSSTSQILSDSTVLAGARESKHLQVSPGEPVRTIGRLRLADGEPMALEWMTVPDALVPGLDVLELANDSFYRLLAERYNVTIVGGRQRMEASITDPEESRLLEVPLHSPALVVERVMWSSERRIVEYVRSICRGDRYTFTTDLLPPSPEPR